MHIHHSENGITNESDHKQYRYIWSDHNMNVFPIGLLVFNCRGLSISLVYDLLYRDLDFNPNKQYYMATCGDDGYSRFWDVRNPSEPAVARADHSHW